MKPNIGDSVELVLENWLSTGSVYCGFTNPVLM